MCALSLITAAKTQRPSAFDEKFWFGKCFAMVPERLVSCARYGEGTEPHASMLYDAVYHLPLPSCVPDSPGSNSRFGQSWDGIIATRPSEYHQTGNPPGLGFMHHPGSRGAVARCLVVGYYSVLASTYVLKVLLPGTRVLGDAIPYYVLRTPY